MWQLARLLENSETDGRRLLSVGDTIWVKVGPPTKATRRSMGKHGRKGASLCYDTNIQSPRRWGHPLIACQADRLELQPVFRDEVPLIPYENLVKE